MVNREQPVPDLSALLNFVVHILAAVRFRPHKDHAYRCAVELLIDPPLYRVLSAPPNFFPRGGIPKTSGLTVLGHPAVSNLACPPDVALVAETKECSTCHIRSPPTSAS